MSLERVACGDCPVGRASGAGKGQFCPFIIRQYARGDVLCLCGGPADHVWFIKAGVVGLSRSADPDQGDVDTVCLPGSFVGLECLIEDRYLRTARTLSNAMLCGATAEGFHRWLRQSDERLTLVMHAVHDSPVLGGQADLFASRLSRRDGGGRGS
jgi:CRP-like cAMP-binding protein